MRPPWEVEPEKFADKFWIVAKSDYLEEWRNWFTKLGEAQQAEYKAAHSRLRRVAVCSMTRLACRDTTR